MFRIIAAGVAAAVLTAITLTGCFCVNGSIDAVLTIIDKSEEAARRGDNAGALKFAAAAEDEWIEAEPVLGAFVNHADVCEAGITLAGLCDLIRYGENGEFLSQLCAARVQLIHIANAEALSFS